jgi:hypothetical protein
VGGGKILARVDSVHHLLRVFPELDRLELEDFDRLEDPVRALVTGFRAFPVRVMALLVVRATPLAAFFTVLPTFEVKLLDFLDFAVRVAITDSP